MNILVASDNTYYPQLKIFTNTLRKSNPDNFNITIIHATLSEENIRDYEQFAKKHNINYRFVKITENRFNNYKVMHQLTVEVYFRFLILDMFPEESRAMWMDTDIVVRKPLDPFYNQDFEDNYVVACSGNNEKRHLERLGLDADGHYFNAGVILFNLDKIRQDFPRDFLFETYEKNEEKIFLADQDVLNLAFANNVKAAENRNFNYMVLSGQEIKKEEYRKIKKDAAAIHYIRHIKPWQHYYSGKVKHLYLKEMFCIFPWETTKIFVKGLFYKFKRDKKTLENSLK